MNVILRLVRGPCPLSSPWSDIAPVREELFGIERLEQHAESLAAAQSVTVRPPPVLSLHVRLRDNAAVLLAAYRASAAELESGRGEVPAAEWLLDNYHLVEEHIREIKDDLPPGYYRQLPKLADGPFAGYPRVFGLAWGFVAHTDSHFDPDSFRRFVAAYQRVQPLTIGELWAAAITLRIVLVENLRRLADQMSAGRQARAAAEALADRLLATGCARSALDDDIAQRSTGPLSALFAAQLAKRLRDQDPRIMPALGWLEDRLRLQGASVDDVVREAQQRQGASNVTVRNIITSMRLISDIDWSEVFESVSLVDARLRAASPFGAMDFHTRNLYRSAIETLSRGTALSELAIVDHALAAAGAARGTATDALEAERLGDPGYHLIAGGRLAFERAIGFRLPPRLRLARFNSSLGIGGYVGMIAVATLALVLGALVLLSGAGLSPWWLVPAAFLAVLPASEVATALVNRAVAWSFGAVTLPGLDLKTGVPSSLRTLVAVPTLLTGEADLREQIERLEVHHLSGTGGDFTFALLTDGLDAESEIVDGDAALLAVAVHAIAQLNLIHGPGPCGDRFLLLHRRRLFNDGENKWMGWERKRGKLHELNRLLRGATDTSFMAVAGMALCVPPDVRYVITLDADTRLPRDAAVRLVGKMAHPLNRPHFSPEQGRVTDGYGILQPRVTPALPMTCDGSPYQRVFSAPGGMDPYAAATSDVYQDLFGEGSYTGKGIYDVDVFEAALAGRVADNTLLSHDLFEGVFARAGLTSDIEVVEDFPSRYEVAAKRQHRWIRGDWQLLPWIFGAKALPCVGRWKMLDNLRRSLLAPLTLAAFALAWMLPGAAALDASLLLLASLAIPTVLPVLLSVLPHRAGIGWRSHARTLVGDGRAAVMQTLLSLVFLPDQGWRAGDAIVRTLVRLGGSRRHLLEWTSAAQSSRSARLDVIGFQRQMAGGSVLAAGMAAAAVTLTPTAWPVILPLALLWLTAPLVALWASRSPPAINRLNITAADGDSLRLTARRTWRFFETFVTADDNMLPPDNFQESPRPAVAHRTSPTNMGLYLLSAVAARDFGWAATTETVERLEATLATMRKLARFKGHFFNWYATQDLRPLDPAYVSSVDSGNLAGHLIVLANACDEWRAQPLAPTIRHGMADALGLAHEALAALPAAGGGNGRHFASLLAEIETLLMGAQAMETLLPALKRLADKAAKAAHAVISTIEDDGSSELVFWIEALRKAVAEHGRDQHCPVDEQRLLAIANTARQMAMAMDFAFLLDPERKLLSIGYSLADNRLDLNCYDLLASEARLASLFAIAKGDVGTRHWFRLGRAATPLGNGSALISWSGSMFEYLMPSLVMRAPVGSLLEQTNRLVVRRQQDYGHSLDIPWGISESAYNARDMEFTYQYSNFGVPGLGLKRGLSDNVVIAPYATGLAAMIDPSGARRNFARLAEMGGRGRYGFYEALDFTRARLPDDARVAIVRGFMAHHQGMTIVAIANTLDDDRMRTRFHREPMIQACELLLQERMPRNVAMAHPRAEEVKASATDAITVAPNVRLLTARVGGAPVTHLLSNGRYAVMLTATGGGYSRWRDIAITRWREDVTRDDWGSFIFLRDTHDGAVWSAGVQPTGGDSDHQQIVFGEDHAEFSRRDGSLTTTLDVLVSGEDDGEVRRLSLVNSGRRPREIELTSYAELVLTTPDADNAHPAFAKMFVQTSYLPEFGAIIATRRPRSPDEGQVWAAHFAVVEGEITADPQYESDRARFLGRGRGVANAAAIFDGRKLSNTAGTVLDPIFSLRQRLNVPPGETARIAFWTIVAPTLAQLLDLIDKHHDRNAFDRARTLAWTQAQVQLRHLGVNADEAADFQRLAAPILYADPRFRAPSEAIIQGAGPQSGLWRHAISGDLPIVLLMIDDIEDMAQVRQLLRAHEYWRMKRLSVDVVIINERASSYVQDLQVAIETALRSTPSQAGFGDENRQGSVHALRADLISLEVRTLLRSVARVSLIARRGSIANQLTRIPDLPYPPPPVHRRRALGATLEPPELEFFNGLGGFAKDGREYVIHLRSGQTTPAPWINVIANPAFGFQVAAEGSGYSWAENSRENQLTPWSNDPVSDPPGEVLYVRDEESGELWTPTARPIMDGGDYLARHGFGYSRFDHQAGGIALDLLQYVPLADPIKISRLTVTNRSGRARRLAVTAYAEWVLGGARGASGPFIITSIDDGTGAMLARNPWNIGFSNRIAFADLGGRQSAWTADRTEFLGHHGDLSAPAALTGPGLLSKAVGAGLDPCSALQAGVELAAGQSVEIVWFLGQCPSLAEALALISRYRKTDLDAVLAAVTDHWRTLLGAVQVKTPDRAMDIMVNGWLLYQTLACRIWARAGFYQASGAYGFRDQLQDGMALTFARPEETRRHLLRAAARQFGDGDVQHWWLPHSGAGVRTRISDDRVWLAYAVATYVGCSGDGGILEEMLPFLQGPRLHPGENDAVFQPMTDGKPATLFEHCARGLDQCLDLTGEHGLPLIGTGDWNDGMNRVGADGKGESVWLGWLLARTIDLFAPLAPPAEAERVRRWRDHVARLRDGIERHAWDGAWYRRATYDDGTWLGSEAGDECRIDSIAQSWAVLSGAADPVRAATAIASLERHLIRDDDGLALLFTPPFDRTERDPGYIKGYPPGLRENGGQYSHAGMWAIQAFARLGQADKAARLFALLNPINHARDAAAVARYKVEPYVLAADVYSVPPHVGRGGWTWYTGAAGWMYRGAVEDILGISRQGAVLVVAPRLPAGWPGYQVTVDMATGYCRIVVTALTDGEAGAILDGKAVPCPDGRVQVALDGGRHDLHIHL
ncbi:MAG: cyclic beta-1 2-glucan [Rhodospirillaceae bacterium]|nr:MAG: cyclic beta-1 2-glucan [Rhodospirillaceae bacterium]TNC94925.1 MAG: cyclic beta-1,2-glucan synthetase [Stygiobacter sp.]